MESHVQILQFQTINPLKRSSSDYLSFQLFKELHLIHFAVTFKYKRETFTMSQLRNVLEGKGFNQIVPNPTLKLPPECFLERNWASETSILIIKKILIKTRCLSIDCPIIYKALKPCPGPSRGNDRYGVCGLRQGQFLLSVLPTWVNLDWHLRVIPYMSTCGRLGVHHSSI